MNVSKLADHIFNEKAYQWFVAGLIGFCGFLLGVLYSGDKINRHERISGHPVMAERVASIEQDVENNRQSMIALTSEVQANHDLLLQIIAKLPQ